MTRVLGCEAGDCLRSTLSENAPSSGVQGKSGEFSGAQRHIVHVFPSFGFGGVPIRIADVVSKLGSAYRHDIVALDGCYDSRVRLAPDIQAGMIESEISPGSFVKGVSRARRAIGRLGPDLLATYNWGAVEWALANTLFTRISHVHFESGFGPEEADHQITRRVLMRRVALAGASKLVVPSRTLERIALDTWHIGRHKVHYVPNGVDLDKFSKAPDARATKGFEKQPGELIVGTVAPLRREKNVERLIRAFAAVEAGVRAVRLLIVGEGKERPHLEAVVREIGLSDRVIFAGHVDRVEQVLGLIDVFVISSDTEQMPNALIQAMAAGRAVAAVDVGDVGIIVNDANYPYIVPRDDPTALAEAIARLLSDGDLRQSLGLANLAHVRKTYDLDRMLTAYRAIFDDRPIPLAA